MSHYSRVRVRHAERAFPRSLFVPPLPLLSPSIQNLLIITLILVLTCLQHISCLLSPFFHPFVLASFWASSVRHCVSHLQWYSLRPSPVTTTASICLFSHFSCPASIPPTPVTHRAESVCSQFLCSLRRKTNKNTKKEVVLQERKTSVNLAGASLSLSVCLSLSELFCTVAGLFDCLQVSEFVCHHSAVFTVRVPWQCRIKKRRVCGFSCASERITYFKCSFKKKIPARFRFFYTLFNNIS